MALIPAQYVEPRDNVTIRLDHDVHERLQHYAEFIQSPKEYVIAQVLERLFRTDKEFRKWLAARARSMPEVPAEVDTEVKPVGGKRERV